MKAKIINILTNKNILWNVIGITANSIYSVFLTIYITRINGIEAAGQFSFAFYIVSIFQTIGNYGGRIYQISDTTAKYTDSHYVSLKHFTALFMLVVSIVFCWFNGYNFMKISLIVVLIGYRIFEDIAEAYYGILQKNNRLDIIGKSMTIKVVISLLLFYIINQMTRNIVLASLGFVIGFAIVYFVYDLKKAKLYQMVKFTVNKKIVFLAKESFQVFLYTFFNILMLNITRYFVDFRINDTIQGYFTIIVMPASLISLFAQFLVQPMITGLVEDFNNNNYKYFTKKCYKLIAILFMVGIFGSIISYFILPQMLEIVYGIPLIEYRLEISLVILAGICSGGTIVISTILVIMRKLNSQVIAYIISILIAVGISYLMVYDSVKMATYAYIIGLFIQFAILMVILIYYLKFLKKEHIDDYENADFINEKKFKI